MMLYIILCVKNEPSFPDDKFNRLWQSFNDTNPIVESHSNITSSKFWNVPPVKAFKHAITTSRGKTLQIQWPPMWLPSAKYYISLYFQDNRTPSPYSWRVFDVAVNGEIFYRDLNVTTSGVTVYSTQWLLSGQTQIVLTPANGIPVGPVINAGEIMQILPLAGNTFDRDGTLHILTQFIIYFTPLTLFFSTKHIHRW